MTRAASSTHLGGIGLMLEVAHICPRCGQRVSDEPEATARHLAKNGCRPAVYAALPDNDRSADETQPTPAGRRIRDFETPIPRGRRAASPFPAGGYDVVSAAPGPTGRALSIPWLRPPDLGEVL